MSDAEVNNNTLLLRQVHPSFVQQGRVTSQAFRPTPKDRDQLSAYDGDKISPEPAWEHFTSELGHSSSGVLGVTCAECTDLALSVRSDPEPFPEHMLIDFSSLDRKKTEQVAKKLRSKATARDWLFRVRPAGD